MIENIVGGDSQLQALHLFYLNGFSKRHVNTNCMRTNNDVAPGIAERSRRVGEGRSVEPMQNAGIAQLNRLSGNYIGPMRAGLIWKAPGFTTFSK